MSVCKKIHNQCKQAAVVGYTCWVSSFPYLVSIINGDSGVPEEIKHLIKEGNRAYYAYKGLMNSTLITKLTIMKIYMTLIRSVVTYASDTWILCVRDIKNLFWKTNIKEDIWVTSV
jgi:hypothetical protein